MRRTRSARRGLARTGAALLLALVLVACGDNKAEPSGGGGGGGGGGADALVGGDAGAGDVSWATDIQPIFANYCTGCHSSERTGASRGGAPSSYDFDTYEGARASADVGLNAIARRRMPPGGVQVPAADQALLRAWLDAGFPL